MEESQFGSGFFMKRRRSRNGALHTVMNRTDVGDGRAAATARHVSRQARTEWDGDDMTFSAWDLVKNTPSKDTYAAVVSATTTDDNLEGMHADILDISGPGPASLRPMPGFQTQQNHGRTAPVSAGRLPNGKLGVYHPWRKSSLRKGDCKFSGRMLTKGRRRRCWCCELGVWYASRRRWYRDPTTKCHGDHEFLCTKSFRLSASDSSRSYVSQSIVGHHGSAKLRNRHLWGTLDAGPYVLLCILTINLITGSFRVYRQGPKVFRRIQVRLFGAVLD